MESILKNLLLKESMIDSFVNDVKRKNFPIALFGCGNALQYAFSFLELKDLRPAILIDNDEKIIGTKINGLMVHSFDCFMQMQGDFVVLIVTQNLVIINQIKDQLAGIISSGNVYSFDFIHFMIYNQIQTEKTFKEFAEKNIDSLIWLYNNLEDEKSKETLIGFISGRITSDYHYYNEIFVKDNYFVEGIVSLSAEEVFIDCGAFNGDTIREFIKKTKSNCKIHAFEADVSNFKLLESYIKENGIPNISVYNNAVWNKKTTITFDTAGDMLSRVCCDGFVTVQAVALDDLINEPVTHIKMDIEGAEYEALEGAKTIIATYKPKLTVCVYHKYEDITRIPLLIMKIEPKYKLFLRHHMPCGAELILYAIPR